MSEATKCDVCGVYCIIGKFFLSVKGRLEGTCLVDEKFEGTCKTHLIKMCSECGKVHDIEGREIKVGEKKVFLKYKQKQLFLEEEVVQIHFSEGLCVATISELSKILNSDSFGF